MDRITKSLLDEFVRDNAIQNLPEETAFEHFAGSLATQAHHADSVSSDDISVGAGGDCGIDCIAVLANGSLVTEPEEVQDLADTNGYLDVSFVFTQAERSAGFESAKIGQFAFGVRDFFSDRPQLVQNERIQHYGRIAKEVFDRSKLFKKGNPQCVMYYVTTGKWTNDVNLTTRREAAKKDVEDLGLFRKTLFECVGADWLQRRSREVQNAISTEILFSERTVIPEMPGVEQAYLGLLPATEFLRLIENDNQEVLTSLFYDNVRHWQEWNPVNSEIRDTLRDSNMSVYFPLFNNGVTIVAKRLRPTGNKFLLEDYQVVNGCQTSFVLHESRDALSDKVMVPVRLIATQDDNIRNAIIKATNRQTQVSEEQLFALSDFPKKLEAFFPTYEGKRKLYYERRSRQYSGASEVEKVRVVNMTSLVRAFASMFLSIPHGTTRSYKALLRALGTDIFNRDHRLEPYYASAYAHYRLEYLFRSQALPSDLKPARYHLLLAFRVLAQPALLPKMNSHDMARWCDPLLVALWDDERCRTLFEDGATRVRRIASGKLDRDNIRTEPFTNALLTDLGVSRTAGRTTASSVASPVVGSAT